MHLYVYGDSHIRNFTGNSDGMYGDVYVEAKTQKIEMSVMKLSSTGPTMYGLPNPDSKTGAGKRADRWIHESGAEDVLFVLGEVDCREFLCRNESPDQFIGDTIVRFEQYRTTLPPLRSLGLFGVCPPSRRLVTERGCYTLPYVVAKFNDVLHGYCSASGFKFISVYRDVVDDCGFLNMHYGEKDGIHLSPTLVRPFVADALDRAY